MEALKKYAFPLKAIHRSNEKLVGEISYLHTSPDDQVPKYDNLFVRSITDERNVRVVEELTHFTKANEVVLALNLHTVDGELSP